MTKPVLGKTAVYRLYDSNGTLLYIGLGSDPKSRWQSHAKTKPWWPEVVEKTVEWHESFAEAAEAELDAIKNESPVHNKADRLWSGHGPARDVISPGSYTISSAVIGKNFRSALDRAKFQGDHAKVHRYGTPEAVLVPHSWYEKAVEALRSTEK